MSILSAGGRSATARRFSQAAIYGLDVPIKRSSSISRRRESMSFTGRRRESVSVTGRRRESVSTMGRRRALDLYGTKDVVFTHEQMKKSKRSKGSTAGLGTFG